MIESDGNVIPGKFPVSANEVCREDLKGNALYAAHCGGGNTGAIGIGLCGMAGYKSPKEFGKYPLTAVQVERAFKLIAELSNDFGILINPQNVMTHYEFGKNIYRVKLIRIIEYKVRCSGILIYTYKICLLFWRGYCVLWIMTVKSHLF